MTTSILTTKLNVPSVRHNLVNRPRLVEQLNLGMRMKLTLVSAPAGFGKTTLVSEWCATIVGKGHQVVWVSLEEGDNDQARFLNYLIAALSTMATEIVQIGRSLLDSPQLPSIESSMTSLINQISEIQDEFTLVLDDYHVIVAEPVHTMVSFLLDHLPQNMHVLIASRSDPQMPLARMRARGDILELRTSDLRFTHTEINSLLQQIVSLDVTPTDVSQLEYKTEGWIAGIQLAALSAKSQQDFHRIVSNLGGSQRYIFDYLVEEVLYSQPPDIQLFLLKTSILDRLNGPICNALTDRDDGQEMLDHLERANLFTLPLDDVRHWYRYHHLFGEFLREQLIAKQSVEVGDLRERAVNWYESNGMLAEAIQHSIALEDHHKAADLIEQVADDMVARSEGWTLLNLLDALPGDLVRIRPKLGLVYIRALFLTGEWEVLEAFLQDFEDRLTSNAADVNWTKAEAQAMLGEVKAYQALEARAHRNLTSSVELSHEALELLAQDNLNLRSLVYLNLGYIDWINGNLEVAQRHFMDASNMAKATGNFYRFLTAVTRHSRVLGELGRLNEFAEQLSRALVYTTDQIGDSVPALIDAYIGMSWLMRQRNELGEASRYIEEAIRIAEASGTPIRLAAAYGTKVRVKLSQGDLNAAAETMKRMEQLLDNADLLFTNQTPDRPRVFLWLAQGNVAAAQDWAGQHSLRFDDVINYHNEDEHIIYSRVLIAQGKNDEAVSLLDRLLESAEVGGRIARVIEILVFKAGALYGRDDTEQAVDVLHKAITLAEPEKLIQVFVDMGPSIEKLLRRVVSLGIAPIYVQTLLSAFGTSGSPPESENQTLIEPLSVRELEVLRLVVLGMSNNEISENLVIALSTVKTHVNNIFRKLRVRSRSQAIAKVRELGLLQP